MTKTDDIQMLANDSVADRLRLKVSLLPDLPGCYLYLDSEGKVIYVGKAKRLRRRVSSYFNREHDSLKTRMLVRHIADLNYVVVGSEDDALHLENALIKEHNPKYNIMLKDDKSYPWICVTNEYYPRVFLTRDVDKKIGRFYGPYANPGVARTVLRFIEEIFPVRRCRLAITPESVSRGKHKVCLEYHIDNCRGCCTGAISADQYAVYINQIRQILAGDTQPIEDYLVAEMQRLSADLRFEEAQQVKVKYDLVERYRAKSVIVSTQISNVDVFSFEPDDGRAFVNYMHVRRGSVVRCKTYELRTRLDETPAEILGYAVSLAREEFGLDLREVVVPFVPDFEYDGVLFIVPQRGDKRKLLDVSHNNACRRKIDRINAMEKLNPEQRTTRLLMQIQKDFRLPELPRHIECFDNSNTQGTNPVASCVVFRDGKPSKKDYRHFNIKTVVGPDDFASMKEVLTRRYTRLLAEGDELPQLVIVDGGKGQLSAAVEAFEEIGIRDRVALIGIAKRLEEIYFPGDSLPLYISKTSETLRVVQHLRNEAHRFGITHHRNRRSKGQVASELDSIKGIGEKTANQLIRHFRSLKRAKEATADEIASVVGPAKAKILLTAWGREC